MLNFPPNLVDVVIDEVATEIVDKKVIAEKPGIVEVVDTAHKNATENLIDDVLDVVGGDQAEFEKRCLLPLDRLEISC